MGKDGDEKNGMVGWTKNGMGGWTKNGWLDGQKMDGWMIRMIGWEKTGMVKR